KPIPSRDVLDNLLRQMSDFIGRVKRNLLVVEPDPELCDGILKSIDADDLQIIPVQDGKSALKVLGEQTIDCVILNPRSVELAEDLVSTGIPPEAAVGRLPVIVFGSAAQQDDSVWKRLGETCTLCRVQSAERLLDLTTFFLHRAVANLPEHK